MTSCKDFTHRCQGLDGRPRTRRLPPEWTWFFAKGYIIDGVMALVILIAVYFGPTSLDEYRLFQLDNISLITHCTLGNGVTPFLNKMTVPRRRVSGPPCFWCVFGDTVLQILFSDFLLTKDRVQFCWKQCDNQQYCLLVVFSLHVGGAGKKVCAQQVLNVQVMVSMPSFWGLFLLPIWRSTNGKLMVWVCGLGF